VLIPVVAIVFICGLSDVLINEYLFILFIYYSSMRSTEVHGWRNKLGVCVGDCFVHPNDRERLRTLNLAQSAGPISCLEHCTARVLRGTVVTKAAVLIFLIQYMETYRRSQLRYEHEG